MKEFQSWVPTILGASEGLTTSSARIVAQTIAAPEISADTLKPYSGIQNVTVIDTNVSKMEKGEHNVSGRVYEGS